MKKMRSTSTTELLRFIRANPAKVRIIMIESRQEFRLLQCGLARCGKFFWRAATKGTLKNPNPKRHRHAYCSEEHRTENWRLLNNARQRRWARRAKKRGTWLPQLKARKKRWYLKKKAAKR